jgi:hypothetical protein
MLRIQYNDPEISPLTKGDLTLYLKETGWKLIKQQASQLVYEGKFDDNGEPIQIVLPRGDDPGDVSRRIAETISLLSAIESKSPYEIIRSINAMNKDIPVFKPKTDRIPLQKAAAYVDKIRQFVNYCATVENDTRKNYEHSTKSGREFVERDCFFGHTIKGSFGFTVETTLPPRSQITLDGKKRTPHKVGEEEIPPFQRRVMQRLVRGIKYANDSVMESDPDILIQNYETGLNANMCDALDDIIEEFKDTDTEFNILWSPNYEPDENLKEARIILNANTQKYLKIASQSLSGASEPKHIILKGKIVELKRSEVKRSYFEDDEESEETDTIKIRDDETGKQVKVLLIESDYKNACDAHKENKSVSIGGILERDKRQWILRNPQNFEVV